MVTRTATEPARSATPDLRQPRRAGLLDPRRIPSPLPVDRPEVPIDDALRPMRIHRVLPQVLTIYLELAQLSLVDSARAAEAGRNVRQAMETLGGFWIKAGQMLSLRTDVFPTEFSAELSLLTDRVPAASGDRIREVVERELGRPIRGAFSEFSDRAYASGSIGQVHLARLAGSGTVVSVKVQRPGTRRSFERDLRFIGLLIRLLNRSSRLRRFNWLEALKELKQIFREELDYRYEADSYRTLRKALRRHGRIYVPKVFGKFTTERLLVMEHVEGVLLSDWLTVARNDPDRARTWLEENEVEPRKVGRRLFHSFFRQCFEDEAFHGDPQPSNILLLRENRIAFVDCGSTGRLDQDTLTNLVDFFRFLAWRDFGHAAQKLMTLAEPLPLMDPSDYRTQLIRIFRSWDQRTHVREFPYDTKSLLYLWQQISRVSQQYQILFHWALLRVDRALMTLDISLRELWPEVNYQQQVRKYFVAAEGRLLADMKKPSRLLDLGGRWGRFLRDAPGQVRDLQRSLGTLWQRRATNFQASSSKLAYLFERTFAEARFLTLAIGAGLAMTFVHQHVWEFHWPKLTDHRIDDVFLVVPRLNLIEWAIVFFAIGWVGLQFHKLTRRFAKKDSQLPGSQDGAI